MSADHGARSPTSQQSAEIGTTPSPYDDISAARNVLHLKSPLRG